MATRSLASAVALALALAAAPAAGAAKPHPSLALSANRAAAGARVLVVGRHFPRRVRVRLYLGTLRLKTLRANRRGKFRVRVRVPGRTPRLYRITARARGVRVRIRFRLLVTPVTTSPPPPASKAASPAPAAPPSPPPLPPGAKLVAAGDIACAPNTGQTAFSCHNGTTASRVVALAPDAVLALGDNQYEHGELANFNSSFDPTWGQFKPKIHPVPGNHEYTDPADPTHQTAPGYNGYFGAAAGDPVENYYTFTVGAWHVFVLNSGDLNDTVDCRPVSCKPGSAQVIWLTTQLDALPADACVLAAIHHPHHASFTSRAHAAEESALYGALYDHGAELLLAGHDHEYERYPPMSDATTVDPTYGIREFIVGTGGRSLTPTTQKPPSEKLDGTHFGVLQLSLGTSGYGFRFVAEDGSIQDFGTGSCHGPPPP